MNRTAYVIMTRFRGSGAGGLAGRGGRADVRQTSAPELGETAERAQAVLQQLHDEQPDWDALVESNGARLVATGARSVASSGQQALGRFSTRRGLALHRGCLPPPVRPVMSHFAHRVVLGGGVDEVLIHDLV